MKLTLGNQEIEITEEQRQIIADVLKLTVPGAIDNWPQNGDKYWFLGTAKNQLIDISYVGDHHDEFRRDVGNFFKTKEEAESHVRYLKALTRVKGSSSFVPDWNNSNQDKYCVYYDHPNGKLALDIHWEAQPIGTPVYYQTKESGKQAIKDHKEDFLILAGVK